MKKIFVAIDGSEHAWKALDYAAELAKGMKCSLFVYTALKPSDSGALLAMYDMDDPMLATEVSGLDDLGDFWLRLKNVSAVPLKQNMNTRLAIRLK